MTFKCGPGTVPVQSSNTCVAKPGLLVPGCGTGTYQSGDTCYVEPSLITSADKCAIAQGQPAGQPMYWAEKNGAYYCGPTVENGTDNICRKPGNFCGYVSAQASNVSSAQASNVSSAQASNVSSAPKTCTSKLCTLECTPSICHASYCVTGSHLHPELFEICNKSLTKYNEWKQRAAAYVSSHAPNLPGPRATQKTVDDAKNILSKLGSKESTVNKVKAYAEQL